MGTVSKTSEIEMAEEAAYAATKKIEAILSGTSTDFKGAKAAHRAINQYIRLLKQQNAVGHLALTARRQIGKLHGLKPRQKGGA
jgi:hypothetical protein